MDKFYIDGKAQAVPHNFRHGSLLVIDDQADHWMLIRQGLEPILPQVNLIWVSTAAEAYDYLRACQAQRLDLPRLILLDLYLPSRQEGFEFLREFKTTNSQLRRIPVVILSTSDHQPDISEAYELGAASYFTKPAQPSQWPAYFQLIFDYWGHTVLLPDGRSL